MAYNYLTKIDYSASGDTFYTGMVTSEANFETIDNEIYNARSGETTLLARLQAIAAISTSGSGVLVSADDTDLGYLNGKLIVGEGIDFTENNGGADETMTIACEDASTTNKGIGETATDAEAIAVAALDKFLVPANLAVLIATSAQKGMAKFNTANFLVASGDVTIKNSGVNLTTKVTGKLPTANGGTGPSTTLPIANGGTGQTGKTAAFDALGPTTTKGDVIVSNGSDNIRLAVGTNTYALEADSGQASGVKWGNTDYFGPTTTKGDIGVSNGTKLIRLPVGTNTNVLASDSSEPSGVKWAPAAAEVTPGLVIRPKFSYSTTTAIKISGGVYHHQGTVEQLVYWDSELTVTFSNLGASDWSYLYLDDSAIVSLGASLLTNSQFIDSITEPVYNHAKKGWYNGNDRCIVAALTNGASQIIEFFSSGDTIFWADRVENQAAVDIDTAWTDIGALIIPKFTTIGLVSFTGSGGTTKIFWRTNGQSGSAGHGAGTSTNPGTLHPNTVITDSSQIIEVKRDVSDVETVACHTEGWQFPVGI